jgi:hypothetical protein
MEESTPGSNRPIPPTIDKAVVAWMRNQGWQVGPARWEEDPETGFGVWQEDASRTGRSHALWVAESMIRHLNAEELIAVLNSEGIAQDLRISFKMRIEERGDGYRVSVVPRPSGEFRRAD